MCDDVENWHDSFLRWGFPITKNDDPMTAGIAEWLKAEVLKTVARLTADRRFESYSLRHNVPSIPSGKVYLPRSMTILLRTEHAQNSLLGLCI